MQELETVTVKLIGPTAFPDLNQKQGKEADFRREFVNVSRLKYKHFKEMQKLEESKQMHYAIATLTGLSEADMDELYAEDAAEITGVIYGFMNKYLALAKKMMEDVNAE